LVEELQNPNGWRRIHAQRLLVEGKKIDAAPDLLALLQSDAPPEAVAHGFRILQDFGELTPEVLTSIQLDDRGVLENQLLAARELGWSDEIQKLLLRARNSEHPRVRSLSIALFPDAAPSVDYVFEQLSQNPGDTWFRKSVFSAAPALVPVVLQQLLDDETFRNSGTPEGLATLSDMARLTSAAGSDSELNTLFAALTGPPEAWHFAVVSGVSEGLPRSQRSTRSLSALLSSPPAELQETAAIVEAVVASASKIALDDSRAEKERTTALLLVAQLPWEKKAPVVARLLASPEPPAIHAAASRVFSRDDRVRVAEFFFERWNQLSPTALSEALTLITGNTKSGLALMKRMKSGEINASLMPPMTRWSYGRSSNDEIRILAEELFGSASSDRAVVVTTYQEAIHDQTGDPARGKVVFEKATCALCHVVGETGVAVGPPLDDVKIKPASGLLTDILDPNRAIEERWISVSIKTSGGRHLSGLIHSEDREAITLRLPGGIEEVVLRSEITEMTSSGHSLMPVGLEAAITPEEMADLLAFLKAG
ncbi:MAG: c-type cytochrome, partial [Verrucomicrobiota bacterium]